MYNLVFSQLPVFCRLLGENKNWMLYEWEQNFTDFEPFYHRPP